jgi:hypothetical protein
MKISYLLTSPRIIKHQNPRFPNNFTKNGSKKHPHKSPRRCTSKFQPIDLKREQTSIIFVSEEIYYEK